MKIRCCFVDFWEGFLHEVNLCFLKENYEIIIDSENPDYLFYSCFGRKHYSYENCIKIFVCAENQEPDFNDCDYTISFSTIKHGDRALHYLHTLGWSDSPLPLFSSPDEYLNRKFCNFIYSNKGNADPFRVRFFEMLSKYKKVDAGGPLLNNMGVCIPHGVRAKIQFQSQYKFSLAIENSSMSGYTTEKIIHPFFAHSLPIYWGDPQVDLIYNSNAFINLMNFSSVEEAVEEVIHLDQDDAAYLEKVIVPFWLNAASFEETQQKAEENMLTFLDHIFNQPIEQARRRVVYGWNKVNQKEQRLLSIPIGIRIRGNLRYRLNGLISRIKGS